MASNPRYANGHRRRQVQRRVLAEESTCWLCGGEVDKTLGIQPGIHSDRCTSPDCPGCVRHPMSASIDEVVPVSLGGSAIDRSNCRLAHLIHNIQRGNGTRGRTKVPARSLSTSRLW